MTFRISLFKPPLDLLLSVRRPPVAFVDTFQPRATIHPRPTVQDLPTCTINSIPPTFSHQGPIRPLASANHHFGAWLIRSHSRREKATRPVLHNLHECYLRLSEFLGHARSVGQSIPSSVLLAHEHIRTTRRRILPNSLPSL